MASSVKEEVFLILRKYNFQLLKGATGEDVGDMSEANFYMYKIIFIFVKKTTYILKIGKMIT